MYYKLAYFPVTLFTSVMGIGGLSIAFKKVSLFSNILFSSFLNISSMIFGILASIIFIVLFILYIIRMFLYIDFFKEDLSHQIKINFLSSIPISMLILISFWSYYVDYISIELKIIFYFTSTLQLVTTLYVISFWLRNSMNNILLSPAWFIPVVGNLIVPLAAHSMDIPKELMLFFFGIGCFFWIILTAIIIQRLIFEANLEQKFIPTLFIFIAPPSIFVVDFYIIFGFYNEFSLIVYFIGLFFILILFSLIKTFFNIGFTLSWWAFTFPLCAFSVASSDLYLLYSNSIIYKLLGIFGLICAFLSVFITFIKTSIAIKNGQIFIMD